MVEFYKIVSDVEIDKSFSTFVEIFENMKSGDSFLAPSVNRASLYQACKKKPYSIKTKKVEDGVIRVWKI